MLYCSYNLCRYPTPVTRGRGISYYYFTLHLPNPFPHSSHIGFHLIRLSGMLWIKGTTFVQRFSYSFNMIYSIATFTLYVNKLF